MPLYDPRQVRENCGFGLIAQMDGKVSHKLVRTAISALDRMQHRGGISADGKTGDGCGLLMQKPDEFFTAIADENGWHLSKKYGVGTIFLSQSLENANRARKILEEELIAETLSVAGWREVPVNISVLGDIAKETLPRIEQVFVNSHPGWRKRDLERRLYMARRRAEKRLADDPDFSVSSLSCLVTVYKGLVTPADLPLFYQDLADIRMKTSSCVFHQRFSTNTAPRWPLAQPFRYLAHNGEINTINGNRQWARAREYKFHSPLLPDLQNAAPFVSMQGSDSSSLDNMLELFLAGGMDLFRAMRLLIPPAWENNPDMSDELKAFYEFNSMHMEPWDGPAGVVMTNGRLVACALDRNGLRPARYVITNDRIITLASEIGIWDYTPDEVVEKGRVGPGEMLAIDTYTGTVLTTDEIDRDLESRHPYKNWLDDNIMRLTPFEQCESDQIGVRLFDAEQMSVRKKLFNYSYEEIDQVIRILAKDGQEAVGSMGDDTPMAVMSKNNRNIYDYFRQMFAQVTNPPIDPLRENHVMSLGTCIGREHNVFNETSGYAARVLFESPVLMYTDLLQLKALDDEHYHAETLSLNYPADEGLENAIIRLCDEAETAVREKNTVIIILTDREIDKSKLPIPAPMAVGAIQERLVKTRLRCDSNIIVETASARDPHHYAVLLSLGATAIYPFFAYEIIEELVTQNIIDIDATTAVTNYRKGINKGLMKIMSKMGIACISSYRCSGLFEAVGINDEIMKLCFTNLTSRIQGSNFIDFEKQLKERAKLAWNSRKQLQHGGLLKFVHGGEYHAYNPDVVSELQLAVQTGNKKHYDNYANLVNNRAPTHLRDLWTLKPSETPLDINDVDDASDLYRRFDSAAMSIGALSTEAHEALAIAMNRLGGNSNSGEGGENPARFGTERNSNIKQIASGRFGVTPHYLMNAKVLQIKVAQGAKPGEGGQLPGDKVTAEIAQLRYSVPGKTLISPPPHHDIYSIEDLAQLIFDLKQINPDALVSVKLVSEPGVGTIATGVAKAYADLITISGYDGGTGASPLTSVKYAGSPWELGLAETHQALVDNGLRHKVRLQVDGGLKTGIDVIKGAILGAESFGFGTGPMVALGCKYLRICHLNNCATGVATQDQTLRRDYFKGLPEMVMHYFEFIAQETREWLAKLGVSNLDSLIGRTDLLERLPQSTDKQESLDLSPIIESASTQSDAPRHCVQTNPTVDKGELNLQIVKDTELAVERKTGGHFYYSIRNTDRSVGARVSGVVAKRYGNQGMAARPIHLHFSGTAGQSFGVWNAGGVHLLLEGDANDYVGKGMTGGQITLHPPKGVTFKSHQSTIAGNTCLYGATGGKFFAAGGVGERFAVRNSGAIAVVEGAGDNCCEYMTGGVIVLLGQCGINFGAGMTGGFAYAFDPDQTLHERINPELIELLDIKQPMFKEHLRGLISQHYDDTHSQLAHDMLGNFKEMVTQFRLIKPKSSDINTLLGHRTLSAAELRVQVM